MPAKGFELPKGWSWCVEDACSEPIRKKGQVWCDSDKDCTAHNAEKCECRLFSRTNKPGDDEPSPWKFAANQGVKIPVEDYTEYTCACAQKEEKKKRPALRRR